MNTKAHTIASQSVTMAAQASTMNTKVSAEASQVNAVKKIDSAKYIRIAIIKDKSTT